MEKTWVITIDNSATHIADLRLKSVTSAKNQRKSFHWLKGIPTLASSQSKYEKRISSYTWSVTNYQHNKSNGQRIHTSECILQLDKYFKKYDSQEILQSDHKICYLNQCPAATNFHVFKAWIANVICNSKWWKLVNTVYGKNLSC